MKTRCTRSARYLFAGIGLVSLGAITLAACASEEDDPSDDAELEAPEASEEAVTDSPEDTDDALEFPSELTIARSVLPGAMEPLADWTILSGGATHLELVYDWLISVNAEGELDSEISLLTSWENDGEAWIFTVREGVTFQNGDSLTADDVAFHLERMVHEDSLAASRQQFTSLIDSVEVLDDYTVRVETVEPNDIFLPSMLSRSRGLPDGMVVPAEYFRSLSEGGDIIEASRAFSESPIGSGPYRVANFEPRVILELEANEDYWGGEPRFERIRIQAIEAESTRVAGLQQGEFEIIEASRETTGRFGDDDFVVHTFAGQAVIGLLIHEQWIPENPLSNSDVRCALNYGIDRDALLGSLLGGEGELTGTWFSGPDSIGDDRRPAPEFNPERARELLQESGYDGFDLTILHAGAPDGLPEARELDEALSAMWQEIGVNAEVVVVDPGAHHEAWFDPEGNVPPDTSVFDQWGATVNMNPTGNELLHHNKAAFVYRAGGLATLYYSETLDELLDAWNQVDSIDEYADAASLVADYVVENCLEIPLFDLGAPKLSQSWLTGDLWEEDTVPRSWNLRSLVLND